MLESNIRNYRTDYQLKGRLKKEHALFHLNACLGSIRQNQKKSLRKVCCSWSDGLQKQNDVGHFLLPFTNKLSAKSLCIHLQCNSALHLQDTEPTSNLNKVLYIFGSLTKPVNFYMCKTFYKALLQRL